MTSPPSWTWHFHQHWNKDTDPGFQPGTVVATRAAEKLQITATLEDTSIHHSNFPLNHLAFLECDAFEVFVSAPDVSHYYEFHITPSNSTLQLRFEKARDRSRLDDFMVWEPCFQSQVQILDKSWIVQLEIPLDRLGLSLSPNLLISFGRYDHSFANTPPVISSTSAHTVCNFHRMQEWTQIPAFR